MGFGILFTGLLNMTAAVDTLSTSPIILSMFSQLNSNAVIGYFSGAITAFLLQSSSATIGVLQTFSMSGQLLFKGVYPTILGIYLGDCLTTAIVCSINAPSAQKRAGMVNIIFNLFETVTVFLAVTLLSSTGLISPLLSSTVSPGTIANTNTVFNVCCAVLALPLLPVFERLAGKMKPGESMMN